MQGESITFEAGLTPRAKNILESLSTTFGREVVIGAEHLFTAILNDGDSVPSVILGNMRVEILQKLENLFSSSAYNTPAGDFQVPPGFTRSDFDGLQAEDGR